MNSSRSSTIPALAVFGALVLAACASAAASPRGAAATPAVPYTPALAVSTAPPAARSDTRFSIVIPHGAPATADVEVLVPAGYSTNFAEAAATQIGTLTASVNDRGLTPSFSGTLTAADATTSAAGCDTSAHAAVWTATLTSPARSFTFTIYVHALAGQPTFLHWCLGKDAPRLDNLQVDLHGVFTRPTRGDLLWDGRFTPYDPTTGAVVESEQVSALALIRLPQLVRLRVHYSRQTHHYLLTGSVTENGKPVSARIIISKRVGKQPFTSNRSGLTHTNARGAFTLSGSISARQIVRFRAHATADHRDISKPSCGKDTNGIPCAHKSLALWEKNSNIVAVKR